MDDKALLIKGVTLLYRESQLTGTQDRSTELTQKILDSIVLPDVNITLDPGTKIMKGLVALLLSMRDDPAGFEYSITELLQRVRIIGERDAMIYDAIAAGIEFELSEGEIKKLCVSIRRSIHAHFKEAQIGKILSEASRRFMFERKKISDVQRFIQDMQSALDEFTLDIDDSDPAIVSNIRFDAPESLVKVYSTMQEEASGATVLKTGWQGLNRMTRGGFRRGEQIVVGALQHKYKTGFTLSIFKHIALYNTPVLRDPTKKPMLLRISFEDDISLNMRFLYQSLIENETGVALTDEDIANTAPEVMAEFVIKRLSATGWHINMLRVDPTQWTLQHLTNYLLLLEAEGYEVALCMVDYLYMLPTTGCSQGPAGHDVRDMYRRFRNFCNPSKQIVPA